ncbi:MAG: M20/M25/M40 family metallo-hydrolase [Alphaproteobacteria bacterium]|nr:M20/M25/M40 family metallo-hydrolase [Alphaproteobacteria bacterium]
MAQGNGWKRLLEKRRSVIEATGDLGVILREAQNAGGDINAIIRNCYFPVLEALVARNTSSSADARFDRHTTGRVTNAGITERGLAEQIAAAAQSLGIDAELVPAGLEGHPHQAAVICRVGSAQVKGNKGVVLSGHMDVVPAHATEWKQKGLHPFLATVKGDKVYGRGVADMKAGVAAILTVMALMKQHEGEMQEEFVALFTPGEESWVGGMKAACERMSDLGISSRLAVVGEPDDSHVIGVGHANFVGMEWNIPHHEWNPHKQECLRALADTILGMKEYAKTLEQDVVRGFTPNYPVLNYFLRPEKNFAGNNTVPDKASLDIHCGGLNQMEINAVVHGLDREIREEAARKGDPANEAGVGAHMESLGNDRYRVTIHGKAAHSDNPEHGINAWDYWAQLVRDIPHSRLVRMSLPEAEWKLPPVFGLSYRSPPRNNLEAEEARDHGIREGISEVVRASFKRQRIAIPLRGMTDDAEGMAKGRADGNFREMQEALGEVLGYTPRKGPAMGWGEAGQLRKYLSTHPTTAYWFSMREDTTHQTGEFEYFKDMADGLRGFLGIAAKICGVEALQQLARTQPTVTAADLVSIGAKAPQERG